MKTFSKLKGQKGFTLIELLVVIGILAILLAITLIAINPNKHFQDTRNTQRSSNVSEILNAIYEYESANNGNEPASISNVTGTSMPLGKAPVQVATNTTFSTPNLTYVVPSGNTVTSGFVQVTGCSVAADNGTFAVGSGTLTTVVVNNPAGVASATGCTLKTKIDVCSDLAPTYIADMPTDPTTGTVTGGATPCAGGTTAYDTGYTITATNGRFTIDAPSAEDGATISVTR
ncbi:MAG TPA: type II secretion system protein [Candidatus Saccharimonadales bacterium]|nr:type II secretion system protein [Candidatus Saccharimonadales bacterium]